MTCGVILQRLATRDLNEAYQWVAERAPVAAARWLDRFQHSLESLRDRPDRCPLARENDKVDVELREFLFGKRPYVLRVLFTIDGDKVRILRIRRAQRRFLSQTELEQALEPDA